ncbi:hypothetical protein [Nostoc linckia]|uniref:hypothetical protein n=1 Tax=Nostoc linckia TaxID=92942 RepID=UPI000BFFAC2F|nr:hypothetical protein [Nostoc linckia]
MSNLVNPLQLLINQASKIPPTGEVEKYATRLNANPASPTVILLDISGSMEQQVENGRRKIDVLRDAVNRPLAINEIVLVFSQNCDRIPNFQSIPEPLGNTDVRLAIIQAISYAPKHTLVVSDGHPDDADAALKAAEKLTGTISTLYIGPDDDAKAIAFMANLARVGCGSFQVCDISKMQNQVLLKSAIKGLLP